MSPFVPPLISLFFFSSFAVAAIYAPDCSLTWLWSFNSLGQNACTVAAFMLSTCFGGSYTIDALPTGYHYAGPYVSDGNDLCLCSIVAYSLISACDGCQGSDWISWSDYAYNCTEKLPASLFPNPIPAGTSLPRWALLDLTSDNTWSETNAIAVGDSPELGPGTILGPAGPFNPFSSSAGPSITLTASPLTGPRTSYPPNSPSSSQALVSTASTAASISYSAGSSSNTTSPIPGPGGYSVGGHGSNSGAIAGGTVGGIAAISIVAVALFFYWQRRRSLAQSAPSTDDGQADAYDPQVSPRPMSGHETVTLSLPSPSTSLMRPYDPEDPSTFPWHQGAPNPSFTSSQPPPLSNSRNVYTVATPPSPEAWG